MAISTRGRYAIRMMIDIAQTSSENPVSLRSISERQDISYKYLEQIAMPLVKSGLLKSSRGARGGYTLARHPKEITAYDILAVAEGDMTSVSCIDNNGVRCEKADSCKTLEFWIGLDGAIKDYSSSVSLAQLAGLDK